MKLEIEKTDYPEDVQKHLGKSSEFLVSFHVAPWLFQGAATRKDIESLYKSLTYLLEVKERAKYTIDNKSNQKIEFFIKENK
jgi:hypothetical protein